jgi:UDP-glucose 4-epimerase
VRALVTGGAGSIGSVVTGQLVAVGQEGTVLLDDLSTGRSTRCPPARASSTAR